MTRYSFKELYEAASRPDSTTLDRVNLFKWFEQYDLASWNGECFDLDDGNHLYPIYDDQGDDFVLIDAEIR